MSRVAPTSCLSVVLVIGVALAGCLGGDDIEPDRPLRVVVRSAYDADARPDVAAEDAAAHESVDLPPGTAARQQVFQVIVAAADGYAGAWTGDDACTPGFVNLASRERREPDCAATDGKAEIVVPPPDPVRALRLTYRFDGEGERVLVFPRAMHVALRVSALYADPLLAERADPDGCDELRTYAYGRHDATTGGVQSDGEWLRIAGDGTVTVPFYGFCDLEA